MQELQSKSTEDLEKQAERRREQGRKLQEMQAKQRAEKVRLQSIDKLVPGLNCRDSTRPCSGSSNCSNSKS